MNSLIQRINRSMITGWLVIVAVLFVTYTVEVVKGERTVPYLLMFLAATVLPAVVCFIIYLKNPAWKHLHHAIVAGYFVMYIFVMLTGSTAMVFTYILPMLSLLILYHKPSLILSTGIASLLINLVSIAYNVYTGAFTIENSKDAEIQVALIALCFGGSYIATKLYNSIAKQNEEYLNKLNEKNLQIQDMTMKTITTIANALDAKDSYSEGHSRRVAIYASQIARELGMSEEEIKNIQIVALLHDIGKIGIPDAVLNKPGKLTDEEFDQMKQHTVAGCDILKDIDIPSVNIATRSHHERFDGRGYPDGLAGEDIPYIARIIAVADSYDAMTSNRVYRKHLTYEQVMSELEKGKGTQFDPVIAQTMEKLIVNGAVKNLSPDATAELTS